MQLSGQVTERGLSGRKLFTRTARILGGIRASVKPKKPKSQQKPLALVGIT